MSIGAFTEKFHQPTMDEVQAVIGPQLAAWHALIAFIRTHYPADEDFTFLYGKTYGWALRFRLRGKLLTSLYPAAGGFTVQINLSPAAVAQAEQMQLSANAQQALARATPYPEGRWVFIPIESTADLYTVQQLLALRVDTKRLQPKVLA